MMAQWGSGEMSRQCHRCFDVRLSFLRLGAGLAMEDRRTRAALPTWWGHSTSADYAERVWTAEESNDPVLGIFLLYSTLCIIPSQREWWHLVSLLYASLRFLLRDGALGISLYTLPLEQWFQALSWEEAHQGRGSWQAVRLYRAERPRYPAPKHAIAPASQLVPDPAGDSSSSCRPFEPCWTTGSTWPGASGIGARWMCRLGWGAARSGRPSVCCKTALRCWRGRGGRQGHRRGGG